MVCSNDWVLVFNVYNFGGFLIVKMYDGDGLQEFEVELCDVVGNSYLIKVSGQFEWDDIQVFEVKGNYMVFLCQLQGIFQYFNIVGFQFIGVLIMVVNVDIIGKL